MTVYDLPEEIPYEEEGHVDDHKIIHRGLKDHEDRIRGVEEGKSDSTHKHTSGDITDSTAVGRSLMTSENAAGARSAISAAAASHTHPVSQITGLQDTLNSIDGNIGSINTELESKANLVGGKIPTSEIPAVALTKPSSVSNRAQLLALTAEEGDVGIITSGADQGTYMLGDGPSNQFASWVLLATSPDIPVQSVNGQVGTVNLSHLDVGAAPASHTHAISNITGLQTSLDGKVNNTDPRLTDSRTPTAHTHPWGEVTGKPSTFTPSAHTHTMTQVTGLSSALDSKVDDDDPRLTNARTPTAHTHTIANITSLQTTLNSITSDISGQGTRLSAVESGLSSKANLVGGKIPTSEIPEVALTKPSSVTSRAALLSLTAQEGDVGIITTGPDKGSYMLGDGPSNQFSSWILLSASAESPVQSVNGQVGTINLSYGDVGAAPATHTHTWSQVTGKPSVFLPSDHTHDAADVTGALTDQVDASAAMVDIVDPDTGEPSGYPVRLGDRLGTMWGGLLTVFDALEAKSSIGHTHDGADITGALTDQVDATAATVKEYDIETGQLIEDADPIPLGAGVSIGLQAYGRLLQLTASLIRKSDVGHTHTIGDTDGLQAALDDRPTHTEMDTALDAKVQLVTEFPSNPTPGVLYLKAED